MKKKSLSHTLVPERKNRNTKILEAIIGFTRNLETKYI